MTHLSRKSWARTSLTSRNLRVLEGLRCTSPLLRALVRLHGRRFRRPLYFSRGGTPERVTSVDFDPHMLVPRDLEQNNSLFLDDLSGYRKSVFPKTHLTDHLTSQTACDTYVFVPPIERIVYMIVTGRSAPSVLVISDEDAVADSPRLYRVYCDLCNDVLRMGQSNPIAPWGPIACVSRATLDSERHWTPLGSECRQQCMGV